MSTTYVLLNDFNYRYKRQDPNALPRSCSRFFLLFSHPHSNCALSRSGFVDLTISFLSFSKRFFYNYVTTRISYDTNLVPTKKLQKEQTVQQKQPSRVSHDRRAPALVLLALVPFFLWSFKRRTTVLNHHYYLHTDKTVYRIKLRKDKTENQLSDLTEWPVTN